MSTHVQGTAHHKKHTGVCSVDKGEVVLETQRSRYNPSRVSDAETPSPWPLNEQDRRKKLACVPTAVGTRDAVPPYEPVSSQRHVSIGQGSTGDTDAVSPSQLSCHVLSSPRAARTAHLQLEPACTAAIPTDCEPCGEDTFAQGNIALDAPLPSSCAVVSAHPLEPVNSRCIKNKASTRTLKDTCPQPAAKLPPPEPLYSRIPFSLPYLSSDGNYFTPAQRSAPCKEHSEVDQAVYEHESQPCLYTPPEVCSAEPRPPSPAQDEFYLLDKLSNSVASGIKHANSLCERLHLQGQAPACEASASETDEVSPAQVQADEPPRLKPPPPTHSLHEALVEQEYLCLDSPCASLRTHSMIDNEAKDDAASSLLPTTQQSVVNFEEQQPQHHQAEDYRREDHQPTPAPKPVVVEPAMSSTGVPRRSSNKFARGYLRAPCLREASSPATNFSRKRFRGEMRSTPGSRAALIAMTLPSAPSTTHHKAYTDNTSCARDGSMYQGGAISAPRRIDKPRIEARGPLLNPPRLGVQGPIFDEDVLLRGPVSSRLVRIVHDTLLLDMQASTCLRATIATVLYYL